VSAGAAMLRCAPVRLAAALAVVAALGLPAPAADGLRAPSGGEVRALVVGIDQYANLRSLKGAAADARDIAQALRGAGVDNMTVLIDRDATRQAIVGAMERLVRDARANDFVIITFAGHGAQVPERVRGSKPDGKDEVYVLRDYDPNTRRGTPDIIIGPEIKHWVGALEAKGVDVFVVADTCHGGGLTRNADRRAEPESYRAIDLAAEAAADLKPISQPTDAFRDESTFKRVTFLAAVDRNSLAPEVVIPGVPTKRGALSYAVARMIEAAAAARAEDRVTRTALYSYARQVVSQYAQQKQVIVTEPTRGTGVLDAVVWQAGRTRLQGPGGAAVAAETAAPVNPPIKLPPVRVAALNDAAGQLARIKPLFTPFTPVAGVDQADLVWDAKAKEAIVAGDVIARDITAEDLPAVIDRVRALAEIAKLSETHPQTIELTPDGKLHRAASQVGFVARDLRGRYTIIFNLTGSGRIQYLFPNPRDGSARTPDRPKIEAAEWKLDLKVDQPFGADTLVVITSDRHLDALEEALRGLDGRSAAGRLPELLRTMLPTSARIGFASLFTAP
jgi:caspase domain-containing protein